LTSTGSKNLLPPREYQGVLDFLEEKVPGATKIYYLSYLNSLQAGEFVGAVEHLHKFFDYCISNQAQGFLSFFFFLLSSSSLVVFFAHY